MKSKITRTALFMTVALATGLMLAQEPAGGGEYKFNEEKLSCVTPEQRTQMMMDIRDGISLLKSQNRLAYDGQRRGSHMYFSWPIRKADGVEYNDVWAISGYLDHNPNYPNQLTDYNCGTTTYDTESGYNHMGVDIYTWPFPWLMMDNNEVEIIAAAPGQILYKYDGLFDRSCSFNNNFWNTVYIQHADGSVVAYGHMKNGSVTTKSIGEMVEEGEYLGIVGSSGNSTGPHLHFEAYTEIEWNGEGQDVLLDPYSGPCNSLNDDTWWQNQKPYRNPNINAALSHNAPPVFPACPNQETTNASNQFDPGQMLYLSVFLRDQEAGTSLNLKLIKPDGTFMYNWNYDLTDHYSSSWWYWNFNNLTIEGEWKWQVTYLGQTVTHPFNIGFLGVGDENFNATAVYPNPFKDFITISSNQTVQKATVVDMLGKQVKTIANTPEGIREINLEKLSNGVYFLILESDLGHRKTIRLIKE